MVLLQKRGISVIIPFISFGGAKKMAQCPKCGKALKLSDWRQACPYCSTNMVIYDLQERLMLDADKAEVQNYYFQKKIDRLKGSFAGSRLAIVRIFTSLLPIAALFLPVFKLTLSAPFEAFDGNFTAISLYNMVSSLDFGKVLELLSSPETQTAAIMFVGSLLCLLLSVVIMLVHLLCLMMALGPKGKLRNYALDTVFLLLSVGSVVLFFAMPENSFASGTVGIGSYLYIVLVIVNFAVDIAVFKQGIEVKHKQCYVGGIPIEEYFEMLENGRPHEEIRADMYERLTAIQREKDEKLAAELKAEEEEKAKKEAQMKNE